MSQIPAWAEKAKQSALGAKVTNGRELYIEHFMAPFGGAADLLDDAGGLIALHWAVREFPQWAAEFMEAAAKAGEGAKLSAQGPGGRSWLHWAAVAGVDAADAAKMMRLAPVGLGADDNGQTPLDLAAAQGGAGLAGWLREHFKQEGRADCGDPGVRTACQARAQEILGRPLSAKECARLSQASAGGMDPAQLRELFESLKGTVPGALEMFEPAQAGQLALAAEMLSKMDAVFGQGQKGKRLSSM